MFEKKPKSKGRIWLLPIDEISPSPFQPRKVFDRGELDSLARSIAQNGLLVPVSVRRTPEGYFLIAGERRLMACKSLGYSEIPAILETVDAEASAVLSLIENIHRRELNCFEEAEGIKMLLLSTGYSQTTVCGLIDMPQPTVANKLRLLKLSPAVRQSVISWGLGERIARALLKLTDETVQLEACKEISQRKMSAAAAETYIETLLGGPKTSPPRRNRAILRDFRLIFSSVDKAVDEIRKAGIMVTARKSEEDQYICYTIRVPKTARPEPKPELPECRRA